MVKKSEIAEERSFGARLEVVQETFTSSVTEFAECLSVSPKTVYQWFKREESTQGAIGAVAIAFPEVNIEWLESGRGEMERGLQKVTGSVQPVRFDISITVRNRQTGNVWFTAELPFNVEVRELPEFGGGEVSKEHRLDAKVNFKPRDRN